ncbi:MAG: RagB/SusD family nutrient uptake outer membrane protein [Bacteroidales bacterium]|jgi:hypothetical protein|nr:RagB/SusD family nutrient uptake outer membrane protein [Bacteroidales bacterium]
MYTNLIKSVVRPSVAGGLTLIATFLFLPSCESLLETTPEEYISDEDVIIDRPSAEKALNGAYDAAASAEAYGIVTWNIAADNVVSFQGRGTLVAHLQPSVGSADRTNGFAYNSYYTAINRSNSVLSAVNGLDEKLFTAGVRQKILAQALVLRAQAYMELTKTFGAVPVVTQPSTATNQDGIRQSPREQVFGQALEDLDEAERLFDAAGQTVIDRGRASVWAVYALKARLYLYTDRWEEAEEYAGKLIGNTDFELTDTPEGFFLTARSEESIFEYVFGNADKLPFYTFYLPSTAGGLQDYIAAPELAAKLIDPAVGGNRSQLIFRRTSADTDQDWFVNEYSKRDGSSSIFVARLAEQYLIRAEARLKKASPDRAGAIADIDAIKSRAGVSLLTPETPGTNSDLLLEIENERRYELAFEGHRYFDIIRTGRAPQVFGPHEPRYLDRRYWVHPFPYSTVLAYDPDLIQNEGYE